MSTENPLTDYSRRLAWDQGYKAGFEEGRNYGFDDMVMHFVLYMQQAGIGSEDFAVCKLSQLEAMRESTRKLKKVLNNNDTAFEISNIESILTDLELVT